MENKNLNEDFIRAIYQLQDAIDKITYLICEVIKEQNLIESKVV